MIKRFVMSIVVMLSVVVIGFQHHHTDFSGNWRLDLKQSKDLPASFKSLESYTLHVNQTEDSMKTVPEFTGMGQTVKLPPTMYAFDSTEIYREDTARGSKRWIRTAWTTNRQKLIVTNRVIQHLQNGKEMRYTQTDVWQYAKANRLLLLVTQKFEPNDSIHTERRVFVRTK
jgi:hypothetical protein